MRDIVTLLLIIPSVICQDEPCKVPQFSNSRNYVGNDRFEITIDNVDSSRLYYRPYQTIKGKYKIDCLLLLNSLQPSLNENKIHIRKEINVYFFHVKQE